MLLTLFFVIFQIALLPLALQVVRRQRLGLYTCFYGVFFMLLVIPFYLIFMDAQGLITVSEWVGKSTDAKVTLPVGNGVRPMIWMCTFQACYILGGYLMSYDGPPPPLRAAQLDPTAMKFLGIGLAGAALCYTGIRFYVVPDFPLFVLIKSGNVAASLRDLSFEYASRTDVPYIFLPSINAVVRRILLTISAFILMRVAGRTDSLPIKWLARLTLLTAFMMCMGQFKRAPLFYFALWYVLQKHCYTNLRHITRVVLVTAVVIALMIGLTGLYQQNERDFTRATVAFGWRLLVGEAIGEFLALEHHGSTYDYRGTELIERYAAKVAGQDVETFSEYWKSEVGGKRGYMAVGVMSEVFISVGPGAAIPFYILLAMALARIDRMMMAWNTEDHRPFIAGLVVIFAFSAVKGSLSQLFTGGGLVLVALYAGTVLMCRQVDVHRPIRRAGLRPLAAPPR